MKSFVFIDLTLLLPLFVLTCSPAPPPELSTAGVFVGTSPCDAVARQPLQIPAAVNCEMIKWNLALYQDRKAETPTTYELNFTYGMPQPNTNGLINGGTKVTRKGRWVISQGTKTDPQAVTYQLLADESGASVAFSKLDQNLLHLLDSGRSLAIGNGGWSYTLSRTEESRQQPRSADAAPTSSPQTQSLNSSTSTRTATYSVLGRFVGRSPCAEVARELEKSVETDCMKVKWDLILYHDPQTLAPTSYKLRGTFYRDQIKEGTWTILRGARVNSSAVVYQLDADASQGPLLFHKADDNILFFLDRSRNLMVGNSDFSYTLNREK